MQRTKEQVCDCADFKKNPAELLELLLKHAENSHFKTVTIRNVHCMGHELDYVLLMWRNPPEFILESRYESSHPLLESHAVSVTVVEESSGRNDPDISTLELAWISKSKTGIRDWLLKTFAQGHDPRSWVPRLQPGLLKSSMEQALAEWVSIVLYGTTMDQMRQVVLFYARAVVVLASSSTDC